MANRRAEPNSCEQSPMADRRILRPSGPFSFFALATVIAVVAVDQIAKAIVETGLLAVDGIDILPILALYHVHNTGIAFSLFADTTFPLFTIALIASAIIIGFWVQEHDGGRSTTIIFALILGGGIGNLIDRVRFGYVIDFLAVHVGEHVFFVFNLADVAVTLGLILLVYRFPPKRRRGHEILPKR